MLTQVEAISPTGESLVFPLEISNSGYVVEEIEGLDPVKASISTTKVAQLNGVRYQANRRDERNITITLGYEPSMTGMTVPELRARLYQFFMTGNHVQLRFYIDGTPHSEIEGRVEDFQAPLFTDSPKAQISILCFDPDFLSFSELTARGDSASYPRSITIDYPGTVATGFVFQMIANRALTGFTMHRTNGSDTQFFEYEGEIISGDVITINTSPGKKSIRRTRAGSPTPVLYAVSPRSTWFGLLPGLNSFRVTMPGAAVPFRLDYIPRYGGL